MSSVSKQQFVHMQNAILQQIDHEVDNHRARIKGLFNTLLNMCSTMTIFCTTDLSAMGIAPLDLSPIKKDHLMQQAPAMVVPLDLGYHSPDDAMTPTSREVASSPFAVCSSPKSVQHGTVDLNNNVLVPVKKEVESEADSSDDEATILNSSIDSQVNDLELVQTDAQQHSLETSHLSVCALAQSHLSPPSDSLEDRQQSLSSEPIQLMPLGPPTTSMQLFESSEVNIQSTQPACIHSNGQTNCHGKQHSSNDSLQSLYNSKAIEPTSHRPSPIKRALVEEDKECTAESHNSVKRSKMDFDTIPGVFFPNHFVDVEEGELVSLNDAEQAEKNTNDANGLAIEEDKENVPKCRSTSMERSNSVDWFDRPLSKFVVLRTWCLNADCKESFADVDQLNDHMEKEHGVLPVICPLKDCAKSYHLRYEAVHSLIAFIFALLTYRRSWEHHVVMDHRDETEWRCARCLKMMFRPDRLLSHSVFNHHEGKFKCASVGCNYIARTRIPVVCHYTEAHLSSNKPSNEANNDRLPELPKPEEQEISKYRAIEYKCPFEQCAFRYAGRRQYILHLSQVHDKRPNPCPADTCDQSFESEYVHFASLLHLISLCTLVIHSFFLSFREELTRHLTTEHASTEWKCTVSVCASRTFEDYAALHKHRHFKHAEGIFACTRKGCKFKGLTRMTVMLHYDELHLKQEVLEEKYLDFKNKYLSWYQLLTSRCTVDDCKASYSTKEGMQRHLEEAHHIHEFQCLVSEECNHSFSVKFVISLHPLHLFNSSFCLS